MPTCMTTVQPHWLTPATITMAVLAAGATHVDDALFWQGAPLDTHQVIVVAAATSAQILPFFHNFNASRCVEERARSRTAGTDGDQHRRAHRSVSCSRSIVGIHPGRKSARSPRMHR